MGADSRVHALHQREKQMLKLCKDRKQSVCMLKLIKANDDKEIELARVEKIPLVIGAFEDSRIKGRELYSNRNNVNNRRNG